MDGKGLRSGHFIALAGALATVASLFRPWYAIEIPQQLRDLLSGGGRVGQDPGLLGQTLRAGFAIGGALAHEVEGAGARADEGLELIDHGDQAPVVAAEGLLLGVVEGLGGGAEPLVEGAPCGVDGADGAEAAVKLGGAIGEEANAVDCHWFC